MTVAGHSVAEVALRLGTTTHSLYAWITRYGPDSQKFLKNSSVAVMKRMLSAPEIYLHHEIVDFRKFINCLAAIIESETDLTLVSCLVKVNSFAIMVV